MGNRAVVQFIDNENDKPKSGVYLHWNGGPESVAAFLEIMRQRGWTRMDYASARFASVAIEFFDAEGDDAGLSVGLIENAADYVDGCDNGLYTVAADPKHNCFKVRHNGKAMRKLDEREQAQYAGIVQTLKDTRIQRVKRKGNVS